MKYNTELEGSEYVTRHVCCFHGLHKPTFVHVGYMVKVTLPVCHITRL